MYRILNRIHTYTRINVFNVLYMYIMDIDIDVSISTYYIKEVIGHPHVMSLHPIVSHTLIVNVTKLLLFTKRKNPKPCNVSR